MQPEYKKRRQQVFTRQLLRRFGLSTDEPSMDTVEDFPKTVPRGSTDTASTIIADLRSSTDHILRQRNNGTLNLDRLQSQDFTAVPRAQKERIGQLADINRRRAASETAVLG